jgi:hypothetical protein
LSLAKGGRYTKRAHGTTWRSECRDELRQRAFIAASAQHAGLTYFFQREFATIVISVRTCHPYPLNTEVNLQGRERKGVHRRCMGTCLACTVQAEGRRVTIDIILCQSLLAFSKVQSYPTSKNKAKHKHPKDREQIARSEQHERASARTECQLAVTRHRDL